MNMRKDFGSKSRLYPMPALIVATCDYMGIVPGDKITDEFARVYPFCSRNSKTS